MKTKITELLNIKYPVFQGGMAWVSDCNLAASVSNAGGLGIIAAANAPSEWLREQIRKTKQMTDKPFGVNVMLLSPYVDDVVKVIIEEKVAVVTTGAGNPAKFVQPLKDAGIKLMPLVPSVALAKRMQSLGVDAVIAEGEESGGHIGELASMPLWAQVVEELEIPVIFAGGIGNGAGMAAALVMGAEGIQCGTIFLAAEECNISDTYKQMVVSARDTSTEVTGRSIGLRVRSIKNKLTRKLLEMEAEHKSAEEIEGFTVGSLRKAVIEGNKDEGTFMAGQIAGLVEEIKPCKAIIEELVDGAKKALKNAVKYAD